VGNRRATALESRRSTGLAGLRRQQRSLQDLLTQLVQALLTDLQLRARLVHAQAAGQGIENDLHALLGERRAVQALHVFGSCWSSSTHRHSPRVTVAR
jgi:hypothetical protein